MQGTRSSSMTISFTTEDLERNLYAIRKLIASFLNLQELRMDSTEDIVEFFYHELVMNKIISFRVISK